MIKRFLAATIFSAIASSAMAVELPPEIAKQGSLKVAFTVGVFKAEKVEQIGIPEDEPGRKPIGLA